jgi:hypothetical protein
MGCYLLIWVLFWSWWLWWECVRFRSWNILIDGCVENWWYMKLWTTLLFRILFCFMLLTWWLRTECFHRWLWRSWFCYELLFLVSLGSRIWTFSLWGSTFWTCWFYRSSLLQVLNLMVSSRIWTWWKVLNCEWTE